MFGWESDEMEAGGWTVAVLGGRSGEAIVTGEEILGFILIWRGSRSKLPGRQLD